MEKLELKYLAGYLPYGLKISNSIVLVEYGICENTIETLVGYNLGNVLTDKDEFSLEYCILHLRTLSDLTKEIKVNGEKFVPSQEYDYLRFDEISNYKGGSNVLNFIQVREQNILLELHFDIYGLIPKGLAIDINTLNK